MSMLVASLSIKEEPNDQREPTLGYSGLAMPALAQSVAALRASHQRRDIRRDVLTGGGAHRRSRGLDKW